jgi:hypothetical protein
LATAGVVTLALAGGFAFAGSAGASINNGHVISSNGEAGWFTWSGNRFDEVHADVITHSNAEQTPSAGAPTLGNGVALCATTSATTADSAQVGEVWDSAEHAFDVVWAEGDLTNTTANSNGNACTTGGALPLTITYNTTTGVSIASCGATKCGVLSTQTDDIPLGDRVYVQIRQWNTHLQFLAEDDTTGLGDEADNEPGLGSGIYAHYAQAGTIFDQTSRSAPATIDEADFSWVRASITQSGEGETQGQYFSTWSGESVVSTANGQTSDVGLVVPTVMNPKVAGGLGCFSINVGSPVGA